MYVQGPAALLNVHLTNKKQKNRKKRNDFNKQCLHKIIKNNCCFHYTNKKKKEKKWKII